MKLIIDKFEDFANKQGYKSGLQVLKEFECSRDAYEFFKQGGRIGSDLVAEMYNRFGADVVLDFIDFEEDTLNGFESKYVKIGTHLY